MCDNGPQYRSYEFKKSSKLWDFVDKTSSLEFSQCNKFVDKGIQTIKKTQKICREDDTDPYLAIFVLRAKTPSSGTSIQSCWWKESWKLRTLVPSLKVNVNIKIKLEKQTVNQSRELQPLNSIRMVPYYWNNNYT